MIRWLGRGLAAILAVAFAVTAGAFWWLVEDYQRFVDTPLISSEQGLDYRFPPGASLARLTQDFTAAGLWNGPIDPYWIRLLGRQDRLAQRLQAGDYHFEPGLRPHALLQKLATGDVVRFQVTLVEGLRFDELRRTLERQPRLKSETKGLPVDQLMARIGHPGEHPEGRFLAETYQFTTGTSDTAILQRAYRDLDAVLQREWAARADPLPYQDPYQALIMASIIEKETAIASERPMVAGVMVRRLQKGMRLQTDPTVIYGLGDAFDGNLRKVDLRRDTPYNTYTRTGLPPTPIATVGAAAVRAALHPADGTALYFVATGDGGHTFSTTLAEHNRAVQAYLRKQRGGQ